MTFSKLISRTAGRSSTTICRRAGDGGFFFPTRKPLAIGEVVVVSVRLGQRRSPMLLRGGRRGGVPASTARRRRPASGSSSCPTETQTRDYLVSVARGDSRADGAAPPAAARRAARDVAGAGRAAGQGGALLDIGRGGAFVTTEPLPDDIDVVLKVSPPGAEIAMPLSARVAWRGQPGGANGFGVEWKARDAGGNRRIKELVRRIEAWATPTARGCRPLPTAAGLRLASLRILLGPRRVSKPELGRRPSHGGARRSPGLCRSMRRRADGLSPAPVSVGRRSHPSVPSDQGGAKVEGVERAAVRQDVEAVRRRGRSWARRRCPAPG